MNFPRVSVCGILFGPGLELLRVVDPSFPSSSGVSSYSLQSIIDVLVLSRPGISRSRYGSMSFFLFQSSPYLLIQDISLNFWFCGELQPLYLREPLDQGVSKSPLHPHVPPTCEMSSRDHSAVCWKRLSRNLLKRKNGSFPHVLSRGVMVLFSC